MKYRRLMDIWQCACLSLPHGAHVLREFDFIWTLSCSDIHYSDVQLIEVEFSHKILLYFIFREVFSRDVNSSH